MKQSSVHQIRIIDSYLKEKKILNNLRKKADIRKIPVADGNVCCFLELFCLLKQPSNILEIGCGCGYSSYFMIKNLKGEYTGIDLNKQRLSEAEGFLKKTFFDKEMNFYNGDALNIIEELDDKFDLVFIDGAKHQYPDYLKTLIGKVANRGFIIADNIFYKGLMFKKDISPHHKNGIIGIREYMCLVSNKHNFKTSIYDIGDGISVSEVLI